MKGRTQARLRLAFSDGELIPMHSDLCRASNANAEAPRGSAVLPCSMSLTADGDSPMRSPISESVSPGSGLTRRSETLDAHVVMASSLRHPVDILQRHPVTGFRDNLAMPRPTDLPTFKTVGERIVYWRERRGMTRPQLAKLSKIPYSTLAGIETNQQEGSTRLTEIAVTLRINPHYLATDKGNPEDLTPAPPSDDDESWPLPFGRSELLELDPIELELAGLKFQKVLDEIRSKRRPHRQKTHKAS